MKRNISHIPSLVIITLFLMLTGLTSCATTKAKKSASARQGLMLMDKSEFNRNKKKFKKSKAFKRQKKRRKKLKRR